jgi:hypothetical protein
LLFFPVKEIRGLLLALKALVNCGAHCLALTIKFLDEAVIV